MSEIIESTLRKISFRLPIDHFEMIGKLVKTKLYKDVSEFLRSGVELLLFWEEMIDEKGVENPMLRTSIISKFVYAEYYKNKYPMLRMEVLETKKQNQKMMREMLQIERDTTKQLERMEETHNKTVILGESRNKELLAMSKFTIDRMRELYSIIEDKEIQRKIKLWEDSVLAMSKNYFSETPKLEEKEPNVLLRNLDKEEMYKEYYNQNKFSKLSSENLEHKKENQRKEKKN